MAQRFLAKESNFTTQMDKMASSKTATINGANKITILILPVCYKLSRSSCKKITQPTNHKKSHHLQTDLVFFQIRKQSEKFVTIKDVNQ